MAISVENRKIFPSRVFYAPADGVPLEFGNGAGVKKLEWWGYQKVEKVLTWVFSRLRHNTGVWRTDW